MPGNNYKIEGNQNPKAKIGFVLFNPFQFYVAKNVYKHLKEEAEFIVDLGQYFPIPPVPTLRDEIITLLEAEGVAYRVLEYEDYLYESYLEMFFEKYDTLVSVWETGCLSLNCTSDKRKISLTYGAGKDLTMVRPSRGMYDLILSYGERDHALFSYYTKSIIVGNPKFDDWFNDTLNADTLAAVDVKISPDKKTILYLPTHGDLSSIEELADSLRDISSRYNVLVKPHYYTIREESHRLQLLSNPDITVFKDDTDLLPLLKRADVILSDNSSAIFDAILVDKPVVVADFWSQEFLDFAHKDLKKIRRGFTTPLTFSGSIEQIIKRDGSVITLSHARELPQKILGALQDSDFYKAKREELRGRLFSFNDGKCGLRAADAIRICRSVSKSRERPILFHAIEVYKRLLRVRTYDGTRRLLSELRAYKATVSDAAGKEEGIFATIFLLHQHRNIEHLKLALRALLKQDFPREKFEIVVIGSTRDQTLRLMEAFPVDIPPALLILDGAETKNRPVAALVNDGLVKSKGKMACFVTSDYVLSSDWLTRIYAAHRRLPASAGIGGWGFPAHGANTYDEYWRKSIGRALGIEQEPHFWNKLYETTNDIFYRNPAGDFCGMAYRKDAIGLLPGEIEDIDALAIYMKGRVMRNGPITFIDSRAVKTRAETLEHFLLSCKKRGFYEKHVASFSQRNSIASVTLLRSLVEFVRLAAAGAVPIRSAAIFLLGDIFQWMGKVQASVQSFIQKRSLVAKDRAKSLSLRT